MKKIVIGTTPTIKYTFSKVATDTLAKAILTIKQGRKILIQKELEDATVEEGAVSWRLSQRETLLINALGEDAEAVMMLNWLTGMGVRGVSEKTVIKVEENHIPEVM